MNYYSRKSYLRKASYDVKGQVPNELLRTKTMKATFVVAKIVFPNSFTDIAAL